MSATIIITYRANESGERHANLLAVLRWLAEMPQLALIVVEQDSVPRLTQALPYPSCQIVFAYNPGPFNKSWGLNLGARLARTPVLVFTDADLLVPGDSLLDSVAHCTGHHHMAKPYRRLLDLSPEATEQVQKAGVESLTGALDMTASTREAKGEFAPLCGGSFAIRTDSFYALGGWDERFVGWGGEDDAMSHKVQRARLPVLELDEVAALHLWHPRAVDSAAGHGHYESNRALLARYRHYSEAERLRLAEVQVQVMGRRDKYQPSRDGIRA